MPYLRAFGAYLPARVVSNEEIAQMVDVRAEWILNSTGIVERRFAEPEHSVASLATKAAQDCLANGGIEPRAIDLMLVASSSAERRFPGPAATVGAALGIAGTPAVDLPLASAGSLFGIAMAADLCRTYRNILVIGAEIMSRVVRFDPESKDVAILFGDGAGACVVSSETGFAAIEDFILASDGEFASALELGTDSPLKMDGRTIILQAARKLPSIIRQLAERNEVALKDVQAFILHQANRNLILRVGQSLGVEEQKVFQNVSVYGNTSSASLLIAACEWWREQPRLLDCRVVLAAFGAGLNWGAVLVRSGTKP